MKVSKRKVSSKILPKIRKNIFFKLKKYSKRKKKYGQMRRLSPPCAVRRSCKLLLACSLDEGGLAAGLLLLGEPRVLTMEMNASARDHAWTSTMKPKAAAALGSACPPAAPAERARALARASPAGRPCYC